MFHDIQGIMKHKIDNQQDYNLTENQKQVLLTGVFGDGCITNKVKGCSYSTNSIHKEYVEKKKYLLGELVRTEVRDSVNRGYKQNTIYSFASLSSKDVKIFIQRPLKSLLKDMTDLGLALWFYDDGSLHKKNLFYNLNTHKFSKEEHEEVLFPFFRSWGLEPQLFVDKKKDGRIFYYTYFGKHFGAYKISNLLAKYPINCYNYKLWSSETIQKWSKLEAQLKSEGLTVTPRKFTNMLGKI